MTVCRRSFLKIVHNHTFIHLRGVCADVLLDGAPHGHHAGVLAQRAERQLGPQVAQRLLSHATDVRAARQLNSRVRVRVVELLRQLLQRVRLGLGALRVWCVVRVTETSHLALAM